MQGRDFIITGLQSWDIPIGSNAIDISREISRNNRVLYINSPLDHMTLLRGKKKPEFQQRLKVLRGQADPLRKITDSLWVLDFPFSVWSVNGLPDGFLFDFFNKMNNRRMFRFVRKVAATLDFENYIHFIDNDIYRSYYSKELLRPVLSVYYRRDNLQPFAYWRKHAGRLEPQLIRKSDLVVCNSPQLAGLALQYNLRTFDIGQGVDLSAYDPAIDFKIPKVLEAIPEPRIGYIGDINSLRLDADLIFELAKSKPDYSFIMIGGEDRVFASHALHGLQNVHFLGSIPKKSVPEYMSALQVCMNPQLINEITIGNYPRKVDEYLALGKPVLATKTDTMDLFRDHVYICSGLGEYQAALEKALTETGAEHAAKRISFAQSHSWENNVKNLYEKIIKALT